MSDNVFDLIFNGTKEQRLEIINALTQTNTIEYLFTIIMGNLQSRFMVERLKSTLPQYQNDPNIENRKREISEKQTELIQLFIENYKLNYNIIISNGGYASTVLSNVILNQI